MNLFTIVSIFSLIASILTIVLFFKVWSMTNNVNALKKHFIGINSNPIYLIRKAIARGDENLEQLLREVTFDELYGNYINGWDGIGVVKSRCKDYYEMAGVSFPEDIEALKTENDVLSYYSRRS